MSRWLPWIRGAIPWAILGAIFAVAGYARRCVLPEGPHDFKEHSLVELLQAAFLGAGCLVCLVAMARSGRRQADFYWWVAPAFICFFMFWREAEIDSDHLGMGENAFTWKYLFEGHMPIWKRLVLGVPSVSLALTVLVTCLKRLNLLLAALRRARVWSGSALFVAGIGLYLVAQVLDRANYLFHDFGISLWCVRMHRDDFWEEIVELAGAAAILMGVVESFLRRPLISGTLEEALADLRSGRASRPQAGDRP